MKKSHTTCALLIGGAVLAVALSNRKQSVQGLGSWSSMFRGAANIATKPIRLAEQAAVAPAKIIAHASTGIPILSQAANANLKLTTGLIAAGNRVIQANVNLAASGQIHTPGTTAAPSAQQGAAAVGVANGVVFVEQYNGHSVWIQAADNTFVVDYTTVPSPSFVLGPFPSQAAAEAAIDAANAQAAQSSPSAANNGMPFPDGNYQQPSDQAPAPASSGGTLLTILGVGAAGAGAYLLAK